MPLFLMYLIDLVWLQKSVTTLCDSLLNIEPHMCYFLDDETRVVLETDAHNKGDYINASFINVRKT